MFLHAPETAEEFEITVRSISPQPQTVTVTSAGRVLQKLTLSDPQWITIVANPPRPRADRWVEMNVDPSGDPGDSTPRCDDT